MRVVAAIVLSTAALLASADEGKRQSPVVGATSNEETTILLLGLQGECPKGAHVVVADTPSKRTFSSGCWALKDGSVFIVPDLGDPVEFPEKSFTWMDPAHAV